MAARFKNFKWRQGKITSSETVAKNVTCDYCKYRFISNVDKGITYCPQCKNMIKIGIVSGSGPLSKLKAMPQTVKYVLIAVLIVLLVVFGILPIFGISLI